MNDLKHVRTGAPPLAPNMQALAMPHAGGHARALPLEDGRRPEPSGGTAGKEQPRGHSAYAMPDERLIRPLGARVIVRLIPDEGETPSGLIVVPDAAKSRPTRGRVVAVGPGREWPSGYVAPIDLRVGDVVHFGKWATVPVVDQRAADHTLAAVSYEECLCVEVCVEV